FFQAEGCIRYATVTGVQTCALPISHWVGHRRGSRASARIPCVSTRARASALKHQEFSRWLGSLVDAQPNECFLNACVALLQMEEIGRASCRVRRQIPGESSWSEVEK